MMNSSEIKKLLLSVQQTAKKEKVSTFDIALKNLGVSLPKKEEKTS